MDVITTPSSSLRGNTWLEQRTYFSGGGGVAMVKAQARPGLAPQRDQDGELILDQDGAPVLADTSPNLRWVGNGRVVLDNKGNSLKAYEPYFSSTPNYEDEAELVEQGVTALNHYDPVGRLVRADLPNGTFARVEFTPWKQTSYDVNDTVTESDWYASRINYQGQDLALQKEKRAAQLATAHANTPAVVHLDTLGRPFLAVAHNKDEQDNDAFYETRSVLDIQNNALEIRDARGNIAEQRTYGMLGQSLEVTSHDAGNRQRLLTALGEPMRTWDDRDQRFSYSYDTLRRPVDSLVSVSGGQAKLLGRVVYGDLLTTPQATNHVGRVYRVYDSAGVATSTAFDFKGHAVSEQRQLLLSKTTEPDWSPLLGQATIAQMATAAAPLLDPETFSASSEHDALGRVLKAISPDSSEVLYSYDEAGNLQAVDLKHRGSNTLTPTVGDITYNARGQRTAVTHGPANSPTTTTSYTYDPQSYRLTRLHTLRHADNTSLQNLSYYYDPAGNITDIRDDAQQTVYFQNAVVEPANSYTYDATYRLIEATGREHSTQGTSQRTHTQLPIGPQPMASDPSAMRRYTQRYTYDAVGNILKMQHIPAVGAGWTRRYVYEDEGNRLLETSAPGDAANGPYSHSYTYDAHGSMTSMPHIAQMVWNPGDELQEATVGTQTVYFQYAGGQRSRKYVETAGSTTTEERIYLGPFELYRKRVNDSLTFERETLHISDGSGRICMVETKTFADGNAVQDSAGIWRYQHGNHLGSASVEVDGAGAIISYEEYHPYGTSAYRAVDSNIDVSAKRYRYTGMERDEETGLAYHSARYYAPWLGRWTASDPIGLGGGLNRYRYSSPTLLVDPAGTKEIHYGEGPHERFPDSPPPPAAPSPSNNWRTMVSDEILARTFAVETRLQHDIIERELGNIANNEEMLGLLSKETEGVGASKSDEGNARINEAATAIVMLLEHQFIHDESRSGLELIDPADRVRYSQIQFVDADFPGDGGPHESDARRLQTMLVQHAGGERRPNQGAHSLMSQAEFNDPDWQAHIESQLVRLDGSPNHRLTAAASQAFVDMRAAAALDGVTLAINSGTKNAYRSPVDAATASAKRNNPSAVAKSMSSHSLGGTIDLKLSHGDLNVKETSTKFTNILEGYHSAVYKWMALHADQYGFYDYRAEPWHWEYNPDGYRATFRTR